MNQIKAIEQQYARVLGVVRHAARYRRETRERGGTLREAARLMPHFSVFKILCLLDLSKTWREDRENKVRSVHHRRDTWEVVYRYWYRAHGNADDPPTVRIRSVNRRGVYEVLPVEDRRTSDALWGRLLDCGIALHIPKEALDAFRAKNEHHAEIAAASPKHSHMKPAQAASIH